MTWVKIDDHVDQHPKIALVGPLGVALWVAGLAYCNRMETDGFIPRSTAMGLVPAWTVPGIATADDPDPEPISLGVDSAYVVRLLLAAGLWIKVEGGYQVHDYADYQPLKAEIEAERLAKQEAGRAGGLAKAAKAHSNGVAGATAPAIAPATADAIAPALAPALAKSYPGPGTRNPVPEPLTRSPGPGPARSVRARAHESSGDKSTAIVELNARSGDERPPGVDGLRAMATYRLETICHKFDDDKPASSLTRVMTMLERSRLETWDLDNAIKLAEHETQRRRDDTSQRALGIPMAYFLHVLQTCLDDRVAVVA